MLQANKFSFFYILFKIIDKQFKKVLKTSHQF